MPGNQLVQSLARGLDLVFLLAEADRGMRLSELAAATGMKRPTLYNLLRTLDSRGFVVRRHGRYGPGPALARLAAAEAARAHFDRVEAAVCRLAEKLPAAIVSFSEPVGGDILVRFRRYPDRLLLERNEGAVLSPYQTASGLTVLAFGDVETRQAVQWRHPFPLEGLRTWESAEELEAFLTAARRAGQVLPPFSRGSLFKVAAVPCFHADGLLFGAFGAAWHAETPEDNAATERVFERLQEAAEQKELKPQ